ncbi:NADH-quinone oxidoreductase subunit NuoF, partial [Candidatus Desantisbacteria bacterium]|nr:NADH-quinone oxidoreductase subunit NuoF [Candidatus Desantisbacteria bacterium]
LEKALTEHGVRDRVDIVLTGCNGFCAVGPLMVVYPGGIFYHKLDEENIALFVEEHIVNGRVAQDILFQSPGEKEKSIHLEDIPFFAKQQLIALRNRGLIDAEKIDEYIARDGYQALAKILNGMSPEEVIEQVNISGLRGRGGGGFPTGKKWEECRRYKNFPKYTVCNGDEGDPGAFMDRSVLEADPHAVLEGMAISAYAIGGIEKGYIYVRAEYPLAIHRLNIAIDQAREYGLLGKNIFGTDFNFDIEIYPGAGAFVCGESSALMYSIEGKRGMPRIKPPRSSESGLWGQPTNLNNVETFANVPQIILNGGAWFASIGTEGSKGTKVFALTGAINNVGLVEVPMGTSLRALVFDIGGGISNKRKFKAAQLGGPSGGCIPESLLDITIDFDSLTEAGAMMGSGGVVIMHDATCMVDTARFFTDFSVDESCGKCVPCRIGLRVMLNKLEDIVSGRGQEGDVEFLEKLGRHIKNTSHCGLGQTAANPVLSTIRYFRDEYDAHIKEKQCPARVCIDLIKFEVNEEKCKMCGVCFKACPSSAVIWEKKQKATIDKEKCTRCRSCVTACKFDAID